MARDKAIRRKQSQVFGYGCKSGKRRYSSYSTAYNAMLRTNANAQNLQSELRDIYRCQVCAGFHLTSQPPGSHEEEAS